VQYGAATDYRVAYGYDGLLRLNSVTGSTAPAFTYTYAANANLVARVAQLSGYCRDTTYEPASNRVSDLNHTWGPAADLMVAASYQYNNAGLRSVEKTDGINLMALLQRSSGLYSDFTYTDRRELDTAGQYDLTATWAKGAAVAGTARDYDYDPIGNRTADQSGSYTRNSLNQYSAAPGAAALTYDLAGNLTADGTRTYTYDAENRLASVTRAGTTTTFKYDYLGRRIAKKVGTNAEIRFVYDGWNLIAEIDSSTFAILRSYTWGLDASGGLQAAGGVGGLLAVSLSNGSTYYPIYDGSYNIIGLYDGTGAIAAAYRYDPFGNVLQSAGTAALVNPFGFSTKFTDRDSTTEGGLVYYGFRYYTPSTGRWPSRDPIEELGGLNLYGMVGNDAVNSVDLLGLMDRIIIDPNARSLLNINILDCMELAYQKALFQAMLARASATLTSSSQNYSRTVDYARLSVAQTLGSALIAAAPSLVKKLGGVTARTGLQTISANSRQVLNPQTARPLSQGGGIISGGTATAADAVSASQTARAIGYGSAAAQQFAKESATDRMKEALGDLSEILGAALDPGGHLSEFYSAFAESEAASGSAIMNIAGENLRAIHQRQLELGCICE